MPKYNNDTNEDLRKNKANKTAPIINTVISGIILIGVTILKILYSDFSIILYISFLIVLVMFPISSWYYFYYARKEKTKMLKSYEKETSLIVEYMEHQKNFKMFEESDARKINIIKENKDITGNFNYNKELSSLGFPDSSTAIISIGIGFTNLVIDPDTKEITSLTGLLPKSIWLKRHLKFNKDNVKKQVLKINPTGFDIRNKTLFRINTQDDTYYDKKTGMICIGEKKIYDFDEIIEFIKDAYLVLRDDKIISLWISLPPNLDLY